MKNFLTIAFLFATTSLLAQRSVIHFNEDWKFAPGDDSTASAPQFNDSGWRTLQLPHDWSIEGDFSEKHPATNQGGALPTGVGWYRKSFPGSPAFKNKKVFINFDGVYRNSEVWINGHYLGKRPNGYISFRYELTPYLNRNGKQNILAVKVDNSAQPASRWYSGSGIYRKVWLSTENNTSFDHWGVFITTPGVSEKRATVRMDATIRKEIHSGLPLHSQVLVYDASGKLVGEKKSRVDIIRDTIRSTAEVTVPAPKLWSVEKPYLYQAVTRLYQAGKLVDEVKIPFGIRSFYFDAQKGFFLNGKPLKILGVCNHHDLGALGAAVNTRAIERQLEILKEMGCNAIRTAHNPPAPELLDLCDKMGFIVMDEAFDMWKKRKNRFDYHLDFDQWGKRDLRDMVLRDRNHPSVFIWSIGNEIREQFDSSGLVITKELADVVRSVDTTRPVLCALTENIPEKNFIYQSGALDLLGFNYKLEAYPLLPARFPGGKFIATETSSALATRGHYDMPSDSHRLWPPDSKSPFTGNPDLTVSSYDHVYAYWGSTHEDGWNAVKKQDFMSGIFVWSGFDFIGEPVPYPWPARSSYYGVIDLAGFPKDVYYMYQSEWTTKPVLHLFPHWNWKKGEEVDVWTYYSEADEVELFLNGKSLGSKQKQGDQLHVQWRVPFEEGTLRAVSRKNGKPVLIKEIRTAGKAARIILRADRKHLKRGIKDLSFVTVEIHDNEGNLVPDAGHKISFNIRGVGYLAGVDNGLQTSSEPFHANYRNAFNGKCLAIIGTGEKNGSIFLQATAEGLQSAELILQVR